ncbi:hypothetical protein ACA910_006646 [Epithemia clementina (nom. ined.)]
MAMVMRYLLQVLVLYVLEAMASELGLGEKVSCQIELHMHDQPKQVSIDIAGPSPSAKIVKSTTYRPSGASVATRSEFFFLETGQDYSLKLLLLMQDVASRQGNNDSNNDGMFMVACRFGARVKIAKSGPVSFESSGNVISFHVAQQPHRKSSLQQQEATPQLTQNL